MKRLTTDIPKDNLESALNLFYAKDGEAWVLRGGPEPAYADVTLFNFIRSTILNVLGCKCSILDLDNEELGYVLYDWLFYGNSTVEGLIATLYTAAWAFAELRARLKMYEDQEEERENGCEYCADSENLYHHSSELHSSMDENVYISGNDLVVDIGCHSYGSSTIKYCPMCGRKLPQPPNTDQE